MKRILGIVTFCFLVASISFAQNDESHSTQNMDEAKEGPIMKFESMEIDYGTIEQNSEPYREFKFVNTGNTPLVINNAKGSCGCTVPEWPKEAIAPGASNIIKVRYATNRIGKFTKTITLTTNEVESTHVLRIKGNVLKPKEKTTPEDKDGKS